MAGGGSTGRWWRPLRYTFGALLCLVTVVGMLVGAPWFMSLSGFCAAFTIILGKRRIFRAGVTRMSEEIICRYIPWFEGNAYFLNIGLPLFGVASIAAGNAPGFPAWLRFSGILLIVLTPLFTSSAVRMWRRSSLIITPSALTVRVVAPKDQPIEIPRERVESITPKVVPNGVGGQWLQVEIDYRAADSSDEEIKTVVLGLQLTVQPFNLLSALTAWKEFIHDSPSELLDRVERALLDRSTAGV